MRSRAIWDLFEHDFDRENKSDLKLWLKAGDGDLEFVLPLLLFLYTCKIFSNKMFSLYSLYNLLIIPHPSFWIFPQTLTFLEYLGYWLALKSELWGVLSSGDSGLKQHVWKKVGDPRSLLAPEQPQRCSLRPSQSDFLLPIRTSPSLGHGPCTMDMECLFSWAVRSLEENKVCILQKETWRQWPCPNYRLGTCTELPPPSLSNPSGFSRPWEPQCSVTDRSWHFLCLHSFTTETRLLLGSA